MNELRKENLTISISGSTIKRKYIERLENEAKEVLLIPGDLKSDSLIDALNLSDIHLLGGDEQIDKNIIAQLNSKLKFIAYLGAGYSSFIDIQAAKNRNIIVTSTPGAMINSVAEQTISHILNARRNLNLQNISVKNGEWQVSMTQELYGASVGIVGMGAIARNISYLLTSFGCEISYWSRSRKPEIELSAKIQYSDLKALLSSNEIIILMLPTNEETINLFDKDLLENFRRGSILINTAGARLVEPKALALALDSGRISYASFDGYFVEPLPKNYIDPYNLINRKDNKFFITPHSAALTNTARDRMAEMATSSIISYIKTGIDKYQIL